VKKRITYIDWIRIVAAIMVVMIHTSGMLLQHSDFGSAGYWIGLCNGELVRAAVPLFFMISGALILRDGYDCSPKRMVHKAIKVGLIVLVWGFFYSWLSIEQISIKSVVFATIKGHFHFWFFAYLIGLYLLMPILKVFTTHRGGTC